MADETHAPARHLAVNAAVKAVYLALPGRDESGWGAVSGDPRKFNRVWRMALGLPLAGDPPPDDLRALHPDDWPKPG